MQQPLAINSRPECGVFVFDDVLPDPLPYRVNALKADFRTIEIGAAAFHGIAPGASDPALPQWIVELFPALTPKLTLFRRSPAGQVEPHYVHAAEDAT